MLRSTVTVLVVLVIGGVLGASKVTEPVAKVDDTTRGHGPYSQQYHYSSHSGGHGVGHGGHGVGYDDVHHHHGGGTESGLSFDLATGILLAVAAIIIIVVLAAIIYPLTNKHSYGGGGSGWESVYRRSLSLKKSYDFADTTKKVLRAVEEMYDTYQKIN